VALFELERCQDLALLASIGIPIRALSGVTCVVLSYYVVRLYHMDCTHRSLSGAVIAIF
jgi:hypothetical protein